MFRPRIIPVLLVTDGQLVKTTQFGQQQYVGDPINTCRLYAEMKADEVIILDISARKNKGIISQTLVKQLSEETRMPISVGGGVSTLMEIEQLLENGAERIVLSHNALAQPRFIEEACKYFGSSTISYCLNLFPKEEEVFLFNHNHKNLVPIHLKSFTKDLQNRGVGELIVQNVRDEGCSTGLDQSLIEAIYPDLEIPMVYAGGTRNVSELKAVSAVFPYLSYGVSRYFQFFGNAVLIHYERF